MHWVDRLYGTLVGRPRFFADGWGPAEAREALSAHFLAPGAPAEIDVRLTGGIGTFESPWAGPTARFLLEEPAHARGAVLLLASTGDEGFARRRRLALPLVAEGLAIAILENPFYGDRRPVGQIGPNLRWVADQFQMNRATIEEARALIGWLYARYGDVVVSGYSMGGSMAAYAAATSPLPVACVPVATGASPSAILTRDLLSRQVHWDALGEGARERLREAIDAVALSSMAPPAAPHRAVIVGCRHDGYVDPADVEALHAHWEGSELRWLEAGHVTGLVWHGPAVRQALIDALAKKGSVR